jgi:hypothetical protein
MRTNLSSIRGIAPLQFGDPGYIGPRHEPQPVASELRSPLFDQLAALHEATHVTHAWIRNGSIYSVEINKRGQGGGEFKSVPGDKIQLTVGGSNDPKQRAGEEIMIRSAMLSEGIRESWLGELVGFAAPLFAQWRFGAIQQLYNNACAHDFEIVDRVIAVITKDPQERCKLRERVEREAKEFVDQHWSMIERLGDEIFRRGKLNKREIEQVLLSASAARTKPRQLDARIRGAFHEAGHAIGALVLTRSRFALRAAGPVGLSTRVIESFV